MNVDVNELAGLQTVADYHIAAPLGVGGHGRFFVAVPPVRLGLDVEHVALKVVPGADDTTLRRFGRELRLFARVTSPYLVTLFDAGQHEGRFFYSMELCSGGSLASPAQPLSRAERRAAVADAARAVHALHEAGIAHRDLRPGNVLLRTSGPACIADLGLARTAGSGSVTAMGPIASVGFVDPALLLGGEAGRASDIYSLGALLHFVLTGTHVVPGIADSDPMMAMRAILRHPAQPRHDLLEPDEGALVEACIDRDAQRRPASAVEVAHLIDAMER